MTLPLTINKEGLTFGYIFNLTQEIYKEDSVQIQSAIVKL
jgi:hypothetical protein